MPRCMTIETELQTIIIWTKWLPAKRAEQTTLGKGGCMLLRRAISAWGPNARHLIKLLPLGKIGNGFPFSGFQMHSSCQLDAKVQNEADTFSQIDFLNPFVNYEQWNLYFWRKELHFVGNLCVCPSYHENKSELFIFLPRFIVIRRYIAGHS